MAIVPIFGGGAVQRGQAARVRAGTGFSVPEAADESGAARGIAPGQPAALFSLSAMLDMQDIVPPQERNRRARHGADTLLSALSRLQLGLLGQCDIAALNSEISALSSELPQAADPGLRGVVDEIRQRCAVELARNEVGAARIIPA